MTKALVLVAALFAAPALAGCVATPPTTPQVAEVAPAVLGLGAAPAPHYPGQWWKAFHDPQIDALAGQVMTGNPSLQGALARIRGAEAQLAEGEAADLPQLTLDGQDQRQLFSKTFIYPPPYGGTYQWLGEVQGNLTWNLDFWGRQADLISKAKNTAQAASLDEQGARLALSGAMAQNYINLLLAYQDGDVADQTASDRADILNLVQSRFNSGLENRSALEQAKALLSLAKIDQMKFAAQRETQVHAIAALAGQGAAAYGQIGRPTPQLDQALALPTELPADLLARRPDILAARARIDAALAGREAAHAQFYPNINLAAFVGFQSIGLSRLFSGDAFAYGAGPAIHLPLFDAGKIRAEYAGATADVDVAVADYNGAVLNAIRQTADAITQVRSLDAQRGEQQAAVDSAASAFKLAEERYKDGLSDQITMLTAESTLLQARQQMAALAANSLAQRITLLLSVGGGFEPETISDNAKQDVKE